MEIAETVFLILTFCLGMIGMFSFTLGLMKIGFVLLIITFVTGMIALYFSDKNTFK